MFGTLTTAAVWTEAYTVVAEFLIPLTIMLVAFAGAVLLRIAKRFLR